jgi:hypothetical protein
MLQFSFLLCIINPVEHTDARGKEIIVRRRGITPFILFLGLLIGITPGFAADWRINADCFGVLEPLLVERVCFLYAHHIKMPPDLELAQRFLDIELLRADQLHTEYLKLLIDKKFIPLKTGTQVFECGYDLHALKEDTEIASLKRGNLPKANCSGHDSPFVLVRPVGFSVCYWVALGNLEWR